ncbi:helix-turn-helix transcriptional regulator [Olivibacter sp. LS-1]|uniref:helix-turn-helix domain-containing protein n=1 Tax=Olivibacter sp. LS-1 TaxID=2592345 RepID=UPI0011EB3D55|nr:AraC family transcriptional regulator [Olivibacter sp. LS-1]QEL03506.1 helix-turn-helix transcriptional regulator [Olivibacter sp. LS-1]
MKGSRLKPAQKIAEYVDEILIIENYDVKDNFSLPLFANGKPTLLFQNTLGTINNTKNYLTLFGQTVLPEKITFSDNFILIAYFFKPFSLKALFGFSAQEFTDNPINLNLVDYKVASELQEKLLNALSIQAMLTILDGFIFGLINKIQISNKLIDYATKLIAENPSKQILAKAQNEIFVTERTFQRMFKKEVGISPDQYRRIAQFNSAFQQLNTGLFKQLTDIVFNNGYADQSHFIRTFKEFTNLTPKAYLNLGKQ